MKKPYFLYIIHNSGLCLFSYNFKENINIFQKDLFSGFITAISQFSSELNLSLGYAKMFGRVPAIPINVIFEIMISYVNPLIVVLVVEKEDIDDDMKLFPHEIVTQFLSKYGSVVVDWDGSIDRFESFKDDVEKIYKKMELFSFQIPELREVDINNSDLSEDYLNFIKEIDGKKSLHEISRILGKTEDKIKSMAANLSWREFITLTDKVYDEDVFEPKRDLFYLLRTQEFDPDIEKQEIPKWKIVESKILRAVDGFKTVYNISEEFEDITILEIKQIISFYLSKGRYLEKVEVYPQIISIDDEFLEKLPAEHIALAYSLQNMCDGEFSLAEISENVGFPFKEVKEILDLLGKFVFYKKKYVK